MRQKLLVPSAVQSGYISVRSVAAAESAGQSESKIEMVFCSNLAQLLAPFFVQIFNSLTMNFKNRAGANCRWW